MLPLTTCTRLLPKVKACIRDAFCFHGNRCQVFTEICYLCTKRLTLMRLRQPQVKKYPFSYLFLATIWILCFCYPPRTPLDNVAFIDKWVHIVMYAGTCTTIWIEYLRHHKTPETMKLFIWAWLAPVMMSGLIEILQENCTGGRRSGDWLDFAANATGVTLAAIIGILLAKSRARH